MSGELQRADGRITSAVLVPVYRDRSGELRLVLVLRGAGGLHGGQLGLPGGKSEPGDGSLLETALRETEEEIGLARDRIEVVAALDPVDTLTTGFRVHSFLARVEPPGSWRPAPGEIEAVLTPAVGTLAAPGARVERELVAATGAGRRRVECIVLEDGLPLWGATLRLLDGVVPRLLAGEWPV